MPVYHLDLYRMGDADAELADMGLDEMLTEGIVAIEWADRARVALPEARTEIRFAITGPDSRRLTVRPIGG